MLSGVYHYFQNLENDDLLQVRIHFFEWHLSDVGWCKKLRLMLSLDNAYFSDMVFELPSLIRRFSEEGVIDVDTA